MKTLPVILLAALVAFFVLPVHAELGLSLLSMIGFGTVLFTDYTRQNRLARLHGAPRVAAVPASALRLAA